jgi:hypothetical protein
VVAARQRGVRFEFEERSFIAGIIFCRRAMVAANINLATLRLLQSGQPLREALQSGLVHSIRPQRYLVPREIIVSSTIREGLAIQM